MRVTHPYRRTSAGDPSTGRQVRTVTTRRHRRKGSPIAGIIGVIVAVAAAGLVIALASGYVEDHRPQPVAAQPAPESTPPPPPAAPAPAVAVAAPAASVPVATAPPAAPPAAPLKSSFSPELAWRDDPAARHPNADTTFRCVSGWFELPSAMPDLPTLRCDWRIPVGADGQPVATAADLVAMFPYPTETSAIDGICSGLASRAGFTTLTLRFPKMRPEDNVPATDRSRWYYYPESGSGDAWVAAIRRVREIGHFPERQIFAFGRSGGGSAAHLFSEAHPELVAAIVQEAGRVHAEQLRHPGPMLLLHGHRDYVAEACRTLEQRLIAAGSQVGRVGFPPTWDGRGSNILWSHGVHGPSSDIIGLWLTGVANLRLAGKGVLPPMASWPVVEGSLRLPDEATRTALRQITPDCQVESLAGARLAVARPAPATTPRALVVMAINNLQTATRETDLDGIDLADQGVLSIAASSEGGPLLSSLRMAIGREPPAPERPWLLAVDQPDGLGGALGLLPTPPQAVVLFNPSTKAAKAAVALCAARRIPLVIAGGRLEVDTLREILGPAAATWSVLREGNEQQMHADRCKAMLAALQSSAH